MNDLKAYKIANRKKFQVTIRYMTGKWHIQIGSFTLMTKVRGGKEVTMKIGEAMHTSWFRTVSSKEGSHIDGACRNVINKLLNVKTLADYVAPDFWTNAPDDEPYVPMVYVNQF